MSAKLALGERTSLQGLWTPFFEGDRYATTGKWVTKKAAAALKNVKDGFYWGTSPTSNGGLGDGVYFSYYSQALCHSIRLGPNIGHVGADTSNRDSRANHRGGTGSRCCGDDSRGFTAFVHPIRC